MKPAASPEESPLLRAGIASRRTPARVVACVDIVIVITAVTGTQVLWSGANRVDITSAFVDSSAMSIGVCTVWILALALWRTRRPGLIGHGVGEYRLVLAASTQVFGVVAIVAYLTDMGLARGSFLCSVPLGCAALILGRFACRRRLGTSRRPGATARLVVLAGGQEQNPRIAAERARQPRARLRIVGAPELPPPPPADYT